MAEKLKDFDFTTNHYRKPKYPWEEWSDGSIWRIRHGEDFDRMVASMQQRLYGWSKENGYLLSSKRQEDAIVFQMLKEV